MLTFEIRALDSKAEQVCDTLPADDPVWDANDTRPNGEVRVEGRLSGAGDDRFFFSGHLAGTVTLGCRRCLVDVTVDVKDDTQFIIAPTGDETTEDDPDVFLYDANAITLDIRPAVRESWLLAVPHFAQCKDDCKGLCPHCGIDLNSGTCNCVAERTDSRWDALRAAAPSAKPDQSQH